MEGFTATLALDPTLLRGLRHSLAAWLDGAGAPVGQRNTVVLAMHEATANVMETGASGGTVDVSVSRDDDDALIVHVTSHAAWESATSDVEGSAFSGVVGLMDGACTQASHTVRMRSLRQSA